MILRASTLSSTGWNNSTRVQLDLKHMKEIQDLISERVTYYDDVIVPLVLSGNTNIPIGVLSDDLPNGEGTANKLEIETDNGLSAELYQINIGEPEESTVLKIDIDAITVLKDAYDNAIDIYNNNINFKSDNLDVKIENTSRSLIINQQSFEYNSQQKQLLHNVTHNLNKVVVDVKVYKRDEFGNYHEIIARVDYLSQNNLRVVLTNPEHIKCIVKY